MPTEAKTKEVDRLRQLIEGCAAAVSVDYTGMPVGAMTELRRALRQRGVQLRVVKNSLTYLAADAAGRPLIKEIVQGPTGIAFGFDDPLAPAKALTEFIRDTRSVLKIRGGLLGERALTSAEVAQLAALPSKEELIARLTGQLRGPIIGLVYVLSAPVSALVRVLQRAVEAGGEGGDAGTDPGPASDS